MKSKNWLLRQRKDLYSREAKLQGFLSRAAFKLIEIDKKFVHSYYNFGALLKLKKKYYYYFAIYTIIAISSRFAKPPWKNTTKTIWNCYRT